ncbi:hypothetical protein GJ496_003932 [Pomphorhynchus laevis]|nr:hypothetical protein GJ496_003932 [Pomphorhynchus laevis]
MMIRLRKYNPGFGIIRKKLEIKIIKVEKFSETSNHRAQQHTSFTIGSSIPSESNSQKHICLQSNRTSFGTYKLTNKFIYPALYNDIFGEYPNIEKSLSMDKPNLSAEKNKRSIFTCADNSKQASNSQYYMHSNPDANFQPTPPNNIKETQVKKSQIKQSQPSQYPPQSPFVLSNSSIGSNQPFLFSSCYNP